MNKILHLFTAIFFSLNIKFKKVVFSFFQGNKKYSFSYKTSSYKTFVFSVVLLLTVSFTNATAYNSKTRENLELTTSWGTNTYCSGKSSTILPTSACPSYTASIKTNGSVCNTAPPSSVSLKVKLVGGQSPYSVQFRNEITGVVTTVTNYISDTNIGIPVPSVTTPYTLVSVTDANGCPATISQAYTSILMYSIPATPTANVVNVACSSDANGSITMNNAYQPGSLKFNGVNTNSGSTSPIDSHVDFGTTLLSNRAQFTGEGWIKFDKSKYKNRMSLFGQNDVVEFGFENNNLRCWTAGGGSVDYALTSYPADNAWHHIAVVANGTNLQFYIDGVSVATGGSGTTNYGSNTSYTTKIGWGVMDAGGVGLVGEVFNLSFWNRALSLDEIAGLATGFTQYNSKQVGLLAGYSFNEGSGTSMSSVGSVAPTGTLKGATIPVWTDPSTYSWTSIPAGFTSSSINLTGLSPKTYNLSINLKGCPKTTSFVVNATNVAPTITTAATPAIVSAVCQSGSAQTTTMAYTATTGIPTSYSIVWAAGIINQSSTPFSFVSGGGTVTGIKVPANTSAGNYAGTMTIKTDNGCTATQSITLTIGPVSTIAAPAATSATNVGCSGFTANWSSVAGATGYYLDVSPDSNFGNFNLGGFQNIDVTLATSFVVTGLTTPGQTYYYRVRAYNNCGSTLLTGGYSNKVSILVSVAVTNSSLTQSICSGGSSTLVNLTSGVTGTTFAWTATATTGVTGFTASGNTDSIPVQIISTNGTGQGTVTYAITPTANGCNGPATNYTIVVNPSPTVSNSPSTQTICSGSSSTLVTLASATAGTSFTWTATATSGVTGFATSGTNTIPALNISTTGLVQGTITYDVTPTANGCLGTASNYTIVVNPTPIVTNSPLTQTICSGGSSTAVSLTSGVTGTTFAWTATATAGVSGFTTSGTGSIPVQTISTTGTIQGTVTYVVTPTASGCSGTVVNYTILVNPKPAVTNTPLTQTICSGGSSTAVSLTSGVTGTTFAWTATATAGVSGFTTSGTGSIPVQTISTTGTIQGTVTYVVTPTASGCSGTAVNYTILVNPNPTVTNTPLTQTICSGGSSTAVSLTSGVTGTTFAWTATATAGVSGFTTSGTGSIPVQTISTTGTTQGTVTYVVIPTAIGCSGTAVNYTILVNPKPTVTNTPLTQTICSGGSSTAVSLTSGVTGTTFAWTATATAGVSGFTTSGTGSIPVQTISTTGTTQGTVTYVVNPTASGCSGTAVNYTILVNPNPTVINTPLTQTICSGGSSTAVSLASGVTGTTFAWTATATAGVSGFTTSGTGSIPVQTISTTGTTQGTVTYVVNPTASGCSGTAVNYTILVNPNPTVTNTPLTQTICSGGSSTAVSLTSGVTGTTFAWTASATIGVSGFTTSGTGSIPVQTISTTGTIQGTVTYVVTPTASGCSGTAVNYTILVNPNPTVTNTPLTQTICSGGSSTAVSLTSGVTGTTFAWTATATAGVSGFTTSGTGSIPVQTISTTGTTQGTVNYVITLTASGCPGTATNYTVLVNPNLPASVSIAITAGTQVSCSGTSVTFTATPTNEGTTPTYQWTKNGSNIGGATSVTYTGVSGTAFVSTDVIACVMTSNATPCLTGSPTTSNVVSMTVNALPITPTASATAQPTCVVSTGTITVTAPIGLNYSIDGVVYSNTSGIFNNVPVGSYTVTASNGTCISLALAPISINPPVTNTWNGTAWSKTGNATPPTSSDIVVFAANFNITTSINACSVQINPGVNVVVGSLVGSAGYLVDKNANAIMHIENGLTVDATSSLTFENNASLIQINDAAANSGLITYKRLTTPMKNFDFTDWSSPVSLQTLKNLSPNTLSDKYFSFWNRVWFTENSASVMLPGKGYTIRTPKEGVWGAPYPETVVFPYAQPVSFIGKPNNGVYTVTVNSNAGRYNFIGNPYPSALDANKFIPANSAGIKGTIYIWTHNTPITQSGSNYVYSQDDYAAYNGFLQAGVAAKSPNIGPSDGNRNQPTGNIAAGQGFFAISTTATTGSITFNNGMRVGSPLSNSQFFKGTKTKKSTIEIHRIWLNLSNSQGAFKQTLIGYATGATNGDDADYDGSNYTKNAYIDFYSLISTKKCVIQGRALPFDTKDEVPLGYKSTIDGSFSISIDQIDGVLASQDVFLQDKTASIYYNLKKGPYTFNTLKGSFDDRFVLVYVDKSVVVPPVVVTPPVVVVPPVVVEPPVVVVPPVVVTPPVVVVPPVVVEPPVVVVPPPVIVEPPVVVVPPVVVTPPVIVEPPVVVVPPVIVTPPVVVIPPVVVEPPVVVVPPVVVIPPVVVEPPVVVVPPVVVEPPVVVIPPVVVTPPVVVEPPVVVVPPVVVEPPVVVVPPVVVTPPVVVEPPVVVVPPVVVTPPVVVEPPVIVVPPIVIPPVVVIDPTLENPEYTKTGKAVVVSVNNHQIKINSFDETISKVMVYDLTGRLLFENDNVNKNEYIIQNLNSTDQFLIVITQLVNGKWVTKEIVF
ncbi:Concanavalin A-like lectin/glucanases superfamily [Flavobacteriaceae bacterium]